MVSAGCRKYEEDIHKIMEKMIKKEVQLQYSGCGRKIKGVGKKSFKGTETYKILESKLILSLFKYEKGSNYHYYCFRICNGKISKFTTQNRPHLSCEHIFIGRQRPRRRTCSAQRVLVLVLFEWWGISSEVGKKKK